jgi:hypothetical protein
MAIRRSAYETTACSGFRMDKTVLAVQTAYTNGQVNTINGGLVCALEGGYSVSDAVPAFAHPLVFMIEGVSGKHEHVAFDARPFGRFDTHQNTFILRNSIEHRLEQFRAKLNGIWITENPSLLRDISPLPMSIYASWISESIGRRFSLDPKEQMVLSILAAVLYNSNFESGGEVELDERNKLRLTNAITRSLRIQGQEVMNILDKVSVINSVTEFCRFASDITESIRLKELNPGLLFTILKGTWYGGVNPAELVAVATEHPPTWLAILMAAFSERSYKNSGITKITERNGAHSGGQEYVRAITRLVTEFIGE